MAGGTRYPLFIPEECKPARNLIVQGKYQEAIDLLENSARLGSMPAGALLGYLHLRGAVTGSPDLSLAEHSCLVPAQRGYPYAQFVMGWVEISRNHFGAGSKWLGKAAEQSFLPAIFDNARLMVTGHGFRGPPDGKAAFSMLWFAIRGGYLPYAPGAVAVIRMRSIGLLRLLACALFVVTGIPIYTYSLLFENYSERGFLHCHSPSMPLFRR
jgi:TPR repeat protein